MGANLGATERTTCAVAAALFAATIAVLADQAWAARRKTITAAV